MKVLKTLVAIALSATGLGSAVTLGVVANNEHVREAQAATSSVYIAGTVNGWNTSSADWKLTKSGDYWTITKSLSAGDQFKFVVNGSTWVGWGNGISYPSGKFGQAASDGNIECKTSGSYILKAKDGIDSYGDKTYGLVIENNSVQTYTITKRAVVDGVLQSGDIGTDVVPTGTSYAVPASIIRAGYHFGGWYTNQTCTTAYNGSTITANLTIYAKYTALVDDSYFYYVTGSTTTTNDKIYSYGGDDQFGAWPGTAITSIAGVEEVHGVMSFQGVSQNIYKIPYSTLAGDDHIIFNHSGGQTGNLSLVSHSAYWWSSDDEYHNDEAGTALDLLVAVETKRNAVTASGNITAYSICGVSASDAASLYNTYYALSSSIKTNYIHNSSTYTYDGVDTSKQVDVSFEAIMEQLRALAVAGNQTVAGGSRVINMMNSNHSNTIITVLTIIIGLSVTGTVLLLVKKRKEQ